MRKNIIIITGFICFISTAIFAQQDPQYTQFMHVKQAYNPGYAGTSDALCFGALYRQQWVNFPGAPRTGTFTFDAAVQPLHGGVGLFVASDRLGNDNTVMARASYSFHLYGLGGNGTGRLGIGLEAGILQKTINGTWIPPQTLNDPSIPNNSAVGGTGSPAFNKLNPDFGFGLYYTIPNKMYVGLSMTHLSAQELVGDAGTGNSGTLGFDLTFKMARHYYAIAGYTFSFNNGTHKVTPNLKVKSDGSANIIDLNATYMFNNMIWAGISYRTQDAIAPSIGMLTKFGLKVGYSYDLTTSKINGYSSGTHEIMLAYCFKRTKPKPVSSHTNVRFLED
jgi:type IX secretion system PorP/SprF family membrane protein